MVPERGSVKNSADVGNKAFWPDPGATIGIYNQSAAAEKWISKCVVTDIAGANQFWTTKKSNTFFRASGNDGSDTG